MKPENACFHLFPRIVRADHETEIIIQPLFDHCRFSDDTDYEVGYYATEEFALRSGHPIGQKTICRPVDGRLRLTRYFEGEQEHVFRVESLHAGERRLVGAFRVYSLEDDLYERRPYKGDFHAHSSRSDGRESPAYVAGASRRIGLDFMAVTDHRQYAPSLEAQKAFEGLDIDLRIFSGEEIHPPDNPVHMINFGGAFSINDLFKEDTYRASVAALQASLPTPPEGVDPYQYASCVWCFDKIREGGGLGIFCHPYWFTDNRYTPSGALTSYMFEQEPYDAYELIGGYFRYEADSNTLQVARYHDERAKGRRVPIVGASDAHGCERGELFGWYYTIVFAQSLELGNLASSVRDLYSVAVEALPNEVPRAYGPFRLVKYALFLMREVFPQRDALCYEEGRLMLEHGAGDSQAASRLAQLQGRAKRFLDRCWGSV